MSSSYDDCYFYYYSTCNRGEECPYRHCEAALGTETVCSLWKEGMCMRLNCKFRHMESRINRSTIPCYWESQPTGCLKPHCVFFHAKGRGVNTKSSSDSKNLILPTADQAQNVSPVPKSATEDNANEVTLPFPDPVKTPHLGTPTVPVEPVVVSLNDNEESDSESLNNTPIKVPLDSQAKSGYQKNLFGDTDDFGIKTLEQLRMEKILKESEHFYKSPYDAPALVAMPKSVTAENQMSCPQRNTSNHIAEYNRDIAETTSEDDLRDILKRRKGRQLEEKQLNTNEPRKRVISLKRTVFEMTEDHPTITITVNKNKKIEDDGPSLPKSLVVVPEKTEAESDAASNSASVAKKRKVEEDLRFKIKTLEEIRKEKSEKGTTENDKSQIIKLSRKSSPKKETETSIPTNPVIEEEDVSKADNTSSTRKLRVKRPAREIYQVKAVVMSNGHSPPKQRHESPLKKAKLSPDQQNGLTNQENAPSKSEADSNSSEVHSESIPARRILRLQRPSNNALSNKRSEESSKLGEDDESQPGLKISSVAKNREKNLSLLGLGSFIRRRPLTKDTSLKAEKKESEPIPNSATDEESKSSALDIFFQTNKLDSKSVSADQPVPIDDSTIEEEEFFRAMESKYSASTQDVSTENITEESSIKIGVTTDSTENIDASESAEVLAVEDNINDKPRRAEHSISVVDVDTFLTEGADFEDLDENENSEEQQTEDIFQEIEEMLKG